MQYANHRPNTQPMRAFVSRIATIVAPIILIVPILLVGIVVFGWPTTAARAQGETSEYIELLSTSVDTDFPRLISFSLEAAGKTANITEVELLYGATRSDSYTVVKTDIRPGRTVETSHGLDTQVFYVHPGVEMNYRWVITDADGNEYTTSPRTFTYDDTRYPWQSLTEGKVTVYWYEGNDNFGEEVLAIAVRALENLERDIQAELVEPVKVYVYANNQDMRSALQSNEVEWVGGQAMPSLGIIIGSIAANDTQEAKRVIPHEMSHQILHQATDNPYGGVPLWFNEGLAVYNQETIEFIYDMSVEEAARTGELIPLEALASSFPADPDKALLSYAQSYNVVRYIKNTYGAEGMSKLVDGFAEAKPVNEAIEEALGLPSVDALDEEWRETLPPVEVMSQPSATPPSSAPQQRFLQPGGVSGNGNAPAQPDDPFNDPFDDPFADPYDDPPEEGILSGVVLPVWAEVGLTLTCCTGVITMVGVTLVVILRFVGSNKD